MTNRICALVAGALLGVTSTCLAAPASDGAEGPAPVAAGPVEIAIRQDLEERKPVLIATVTSAGKPIEGVTVAIFVERTFGAIKLGQDSTLDDGTVAVPFPTGLPGSPQGSLRVRTELVEPPEYAGLREVVPFALETRKPLRGSSPALLDRLLPEPLRTSPIRLELNEVSAIEEPFPRALWGPRAPIPLLLAFLGLLGGVWFTYAFVVRQLIGIHKKGRAMSSKPSLPYRTAPPLLAIAFAVGFLAAHAPSPAAGAGQAPSEPWNAPARAAKKKNPIPADETSIATGKKLYAQHCLSCHGTKGRGDGPAAKGLERSPGNLADPKQWNQTDGELFWKVTEGKKPMPTFLPLTSEEERWHVVNYTRTLAPKP